MRTEEIFSFPQMEKQIERMATDARIYEELVKEWDEVNTYTGDFLTVIRLIKYFLETLLWKISSRKYLIHHKALVESYKKEERQIKKCKEAAADLITVVGTAQTNQKLANDYAEQIIIVKTVRFTTFPLTNYARKSKLHPGQIVKFKKREEETKDKIIKAKKEIDEVS